MCMGLAPPSRASFGDDERRTRSHLVTPSSQGMGDGRRSHGRHSQGRHRVHRSGSALL